MQNRVRRSTPEDAGSVAAVEVMSWRAAYRDMMPDAFVNGLSEGVMPPLSQQ